MVAHLVLIRLPTGQEEEWHSEEGGLAEVHFLGVFDYPSGRVRKCEQAGVKFFPAPDRTFLWKAMPAEEVHIREADAEDIDALRAIGRQTFLETFGQANTMADMDQYLAGRFSREQFLGEHQDPGSRFFLAEQAGRAVGYLKVNRGEAQTEAMGEKAMEIERVYVLQEFHRQGIGSMLMEQAYGVAQEWQAEWIWLGVWEHNPAAIAFYERCGFTRFGEHVFQLGGDAQMDVLMRKDPGR